MDRLPIIAFSLLCMLHGACRNDKDNSSSKGRGRVEAVTNTQSKQELAAEFCDSVPEKAFDPPSLADGQSFAPTLGWHWINLWATWCEPCVEEMPRIVAWQQKWKKEGLSVQVSFVSADEDPALIETFRKEHPGAPSTLRAADVEEVKGWLETLGANMSLPVHLLVDPQGKIQCVRAASVEDRDERQLRALLQ